MPNASLDEIKSYIAELQARAKSSQAEAHKNLNPLFKGEGRGKGPEDFVESSFLYMRSCDADGGSRPPPCPVFWLSPDLQVAPLTNLGVPTRQLTAGQTYRLSAIVRNRGDLMVPSAKVEFWLVTPSLGFDTRFATKIGVVSGHVMPFAMSEMHLDYSLPPSLNGHRCLFARVFSFAPLDIPVDDFALNPLIDRHVAQLNLDIIAQASSFNLQWIHHQNAFERLEFVAMDETTQHSIRREVMTPLKLLTPKRADGLLSEFASQMKIEIRPAKMENVTVLAKQTERGIELTSKNPKAVAVERQAELTQHVQSLLSELEAGKSTGHEARKASGGISRNDSANGPLRTSIEPA